MFNGHSMLMGESGNSLGVVNDRLSSYRVLDSIGCRELKTQRSFKPQTTSLRLSKFSNSVARGSSQLDFSRDSSIHCLNKRYEQMNDAESSSHLLGQPDNEQGPPKENNTV